MKWMLITAMLYNPVVYDSEATCKVALENLNNVDYAAACIPAGNYTSEADAVFDKFFDMVEKMHKLGVDNSSEK